MNKNRLVTFIHQMQRAVKHDEEIGDYIETTLDDIAIANDLAGELFGPSLDDLSAPSRDLLRLTRGFVQERATAMKVASEKIEFSRRELGEALGWSEYRLRIHLRELVELEYLAPLCGRFGQRFCYRLLTLPEAAPMVPGLKTVEQLRREAKAVGLQTSLEKPKPRGRKANLVETSSAPSNEVESTGEAYKHRENGTLPLNLVGLGEEHRELS